MSAQENERGRSGGLGVTSQLWQEFKTVYSGRSLAKTAPKDIEAKVFALLKKKPGYRIYRNQLAGMAFLPAVEKLAQLHKKSPYDQLEILLNDFCASQSRFESYMSAQDRNLQLEAMRGDRAGAGMQLNRDAAGRYSLTPFAGSPAAKAGVLADDELLQVEGKSTKNMSIPELKALVLGPPNTELTIRVQRSSGGEKVLRIRRGRHHEAIASLEKSLAGHVLRIRNFNRGVYASLEKCLDAENEPSRLTIDLRGNGGGDLQEAVKVVSLFLPDGAPIFRSRQNDGERRLTRDEDGIFLQTKSLRLLVDRHTASASELMTAALLNQNGVSLQGEKTYGKSVILTLLDLRHGGVLKIETTEMFGPGGGSWSDGIDPARWAAGDAPY